VRETYPSAPIVIARTPIGKRINFHRAAHLGSQGALPAPTKRPESGNCMHRAGRRLKRNRSVKSFVCIDVQ
jgi:hypothetical protein